MNFFPAARHLLLLAMALLCCHAASASDAAPTPQPPYVASVGENAQWIVTFTYDHPEGATPADKAKPFVPPDSPVEIKTVKWGTSFQFVVSYPDGTSAQYDQQDSYIILPTVNGPSLGVADATDLPFINYATDFFFTPWLRSSGAAAYRGIEMKNGVRCFHYQGEGKREAWINVDTMAPVVIHDDVITQATFQVLPPPASPVVLSAAELKMIQDQKNLVKAFQSLR